MVQVRFVRLGRGEKDYGSNKKYVVLADIESVRVPFSVFASALEELSRIGEIAACKFYGYSAKRTKDYGEFIQENSYDALSALPKREKANSTFVKSLTRQDLLNSPTSTVSSLSTATATSLRSLLTLRHTAKTSSQAL